MNTLFFALIFLLSLSLIFMQNIENGEMLMDAIMHGNLKAVRSLVEGEVRVPGYTWKLFAILSKKPQ